MDLPENLGYSLARDAEAIYKMSGENENEN